MLDLERAGKGNDKGKIEGMVGYARRTFMVPFPRESDFDAFSATVAQMCK